MISLLFFGNFYSSSLNKNFQKVLSFINDKLNNSHIDRKKTKQYDSIYCIKQVFLTLI